MFVKTFVADSVKKLHLQALTAFARTDENGAYTFKNLPAGRAFELLPLQPGYQFGKTQGIEALDDDAAFNFYRAPHTLKLLSTRDFNILRKEKSLIIRLPNYFEKWYWIVVAGFLIGFFIIHILLSWRFPEADQLILPMTVSYTHL